MRQYIRDFAGNLGGPPATATLGLNFQLSWEEETAHFEFSLMEVLPAYRGANIRSGQSRSHTFRRSARNHHDGRCYGRKRTRLHGHRGRSGKRGGGRNAAIRDQSGGGGRRGE